MSEAGSPRLSALELAAGFPFGHEASSPPLPRSESGAPLAALEAAVLGALRLPPCVVAFSGGRDSAVVLAAATRAARREGLSDPVPVSLRFPGDSLAYESDWQERIVAHLGLGDWVRLEPGDELDQIGLRAQEVLRRHGPVWPFNAFFLAPVFEQARGGTVLTGFDGDTVFDGWQWGRLAGVLSGRLRPRPRDLLTLVRSHAPRELRARWTAWRWPMAPDWLQPDAARAVELAVARELAEEPRRWDRRVGWLTGLRHFALAMSSLQWVAEDHDSAALHPLLEPGFLASLAAAGGRAGYRTRTIAYGELFGDLLPEGATSRLHKSGFDNVFWGDASKQFAREWDGTGVPPNLIDAEALRRTWLSPEPDARSALSLQALWLAANGGQQLVHGIWKATE